MKTRYEHYWELFGGFETVGVNLLAEAIHHTRRERKDGDASEYHAAKMTSSATPAEWRAPVELTRALRKLYGEQVESSQAQWLLTLEFWQPDGRSIKAWRADNSLTANELAALLGKSRDWVMRIERGGAQAPSAPVWRKLQAHMREEE